MASRRHDLGAGGNMRFSVMFAGLTILLIISSPVLADSRADLDRCKFAGQITNADQNIAACDRVLNDPKTTGPGRASAFSNRCGWWWAKKDPDRALSDCNEAIRIDRTYAAAYVNRGNAYLNKAEAEHAFADFTEAIRLDPKNAWAYTARGDLYKNKGDFDRAFADFSESIQLDPNYAVTYFARGSLSYTVGNNLGAVADFTKSIQLEPDEAKAYFSRGVAYFFVGGHIADAEADLKKAAALNPKDAYAALWLDLAERRNNVPSHLAEAAKQLDMTAWPAPVVHHFFGDLNAAQTLAAAFDRDPKTASAQTCEANFYSGELALLKKDGQEAQRLLQLAANACPRGFIESTAAVAELVTKR